jgi:hypothetical protein
MMDIPYTKSNPNFILNIIQIHSCCYWRQGEKRAVKEKKKQGSTCVLPAITTICTYNVEADLMGTIFESESPLKRWQLLKYLNWLQWLT